MNERCFENDEETFADVICLLQPLPKDVQPSETFVAETRAMLESGEVVSLTAWRRRRQEEQRERRNGRSAA